MSREGKVGQSAAGPGRGSAGAGRVGQDRWAVGSGDGPEVGARGWALARGGRGLCDSSAVARPGLAWPGPVLSGGPQLPGQPGLRCPPSVEPLSPGAGPSAVVSPCRCAGHAAASPRAPGEASAGPEPLGVSGVLWRCRCDSRTGTAAVPAEGTAEAAPFLGAALVKKDIGELELV